eukprot:361056-Pelagomonas_calceolata.AAC.2
MAECTPCKLLPPFIAYSLPLGNQQDTVHQRLPDLHTQVRGAGHFCAFTFLVTRKLTPSIEHKPSYRNYANLLAQRQAGMVLK